MRKMWKKSTALLCALAMILTLIPAQTQAATKKVAFVKNYTSLYENDENDGVYTYTVKNLVKGQKVKWSVSGTGKSYVKLSKSTTKVSGTTSSNKLTINTDNKIAAKNKKVVVTAKVYYKNGKLQTTLKSKTAKIKIMPTDIEVLASDWDGKTFLVNQPYQMRYRITPANATGTNEWSVTDATGNQVPYISRTGVFTPEKEGDFEITVKTKVDGEVIAEDNYSVHVATTMLEVKQRAVDELVAVYSGNAKNTIDTKKLKLANAAGADIAIKSAAFSEDGTEVIIKTGVLLNNGVTYTVRDGISSQTVTAKVGAPVSAKIMNTEVTVNKATPIEYELYDADGINVKAAYPGTVVYDYEIMNGYLTKDDEIFMTSIGNKGTISMTYTSDDKNIVLKAETSVTCVAASISNDTNLTFTQSAAKPNYDMAGYTDNRTIAEGNNYYVHFRALDEDKTEIAYDSVKFESSDLDTLILNRVSDSSVIATAVKTGTVMVIVTASYGKKEYTYKYNVTISESPYLNAVTLSNSAIQVSNAQADGYKNYINVEGRDQYGNPIELKDETVTITDNNAIKYGMATYDAKEHRIVINARGRAAGTYSYTVNMTMKGHKASVDFAVIVQTPPYNGASKYVVEMDRPVLDLQMEPGMTSEELANAKNVTVRLAEYRGGVFYNYVKIESARIMKDGKYYGTDLTKDGSERDINIGGGQSISLTTVSLNKDICTKAQTGLYTIELRYYPVNTSTVTLTTASAYLELTDSQTNPQIVVERTTASKVCKTALELAKNCLTVQGVNGEIVSCMVTGSDSTDGNYAIEAGYVLNVKSVVVQVKTTLADNKTVVSNYTIPVGKTLRNM